MREAQNRFLGLGVGWREVTGVPLGACCRAWSGAKIDGKILWREAQNMQLKFKLTVNFGAKNRFFDLSSAQGQFTGCHLVRIVHHGRGH